MPPHDRNSKLHINMYGVTTSNDVSSKLLKAFSNTNTEEVSSEACQFGWLKKDDKYYNLYSKECSDEHPCRS